MARTDVHDVVVIGGGVVGVTLARALSRYHLDVVLLERDAEVGFGVSKANSGIIHSGIHADPATVKGRLEWPGNVGWLQLRDDLGFGFAQVGELLVALAEEELPTIEAIEAQGRGKGVPGLTRWDPERIRRAQPNLSREVIAALWAPTAGVINPYEAVLLIADNAVRNGVTILTEQPVVAIDPPDSTDPDGPIVLRTPTSAVAARYVVNAAGLYADEVARMAGVGTFTISGRKGEEYLLDKRLAGLVTSIIFPCPTATSKGTLVTPTFDGTIMVGPTAEATDDKDDTTTTPEGAAQVFAAAKRLVPAISERDVIAEFAGVRAVADTEDFILGPTARRGFLNAAGIQSPGLTAAPAIADHLVAVLADEGLVLEAKDDWQPRAEHPVRFAVLSTDDQAELAARDPRFAQLVCRCELITEAEIVDAIDRGARTLDGVKFRTRAGMGRCQGGFCTWRCLELLAERRGLPITAITKRGGGSWIVRDRDDAIAGPPSAAVAPALQEPEPAVAATVPASGG
jgi:glycerol-3-phosphate dehydrogenase